ncbi:Adrenodoxin-like protein 2 [Argiope bruennichi]|uniref:Adrenodoxin-like protein 2 n=2 Tax=Argiope bruennichi TaxID=94029 RepID=A0A8T0EJX3_ARGBR|nr:Adrenodoxin-like protein 2 [Argiope bruennichi]
MALSVLKTSIRRICGQYIIEKSVSSFQIKNQFLRRRMIKTDIFRFCNAQSNGWVTIIFEKSDGTRLKRLGKIGEKVQQVIGKDNPDFPGYGECDGTMSCSCCHVILSKEDYDKFDVDKRMKTKEEDLILSASINPTPT